MGIGSADGGVTASLLLLLLLSLCALTAPVGAVTIDDLGFTEENCAVLRNSGGAVPCPCRLNTGIVAAQPCFPNCCPRTETFEGDRCHEENRLTWSVFEQQVCFPAPPREFTDDTSNCFYRGNIPFIKKAHVVGDVTHFEFELSIIEQHRCHNLYVAKCNPERINRDDYRINTTDAQPRHCWLACGPDPIAPCTQAECWAHRGETPAVISAWDMQYSLLPGDYALVCYTMVTADSVGSTLFQAAFAAASFKIL